MTERLSVEEARRRGYLSEVKTTAAAGQSSPEAKALRYTLRQRDALIKLIRQLLDDRHDLRLEYRFHDFRRWRFDVALLDCDLAIEIDGGGWNHGAHHRKRGRDNDNEKDQAAQLDGWCVIRVSWDHIFNGEALAVIRRFASGDE